MKNIAIKTSLAVFLLLSADAYAVTTIDFDSIENPSDILHQTSDIDFQNQWHFSGPYDVDDTNSIWSELAVPSFVMSDKVLVSVDVYALNACTLTISDGINNDYTQELPSGQMVSIATGWNRVSAEIQFIGCGADLGISTIRYTDSVDNTLPTAEIIFPTANSLTNTDTITVRGVANDESGISYVRINGIEATSYDGFINWTVEVPLSSGTNLLEVEVGDTAFNINEIADSVTVNRDDTTLLRPHSVVYDASRNRALIIDIAAGSLLSIDLQTGERTILSNNDVGNGPGLGFPESLALDTANNRAIVLDVDFPAATVLTVDLNTGDRNIVAGPGVGGGAGLAGSQAITLGNGNIAYLANPSLAGVLALDLSTGDRSIISRSNPNAGASIGSGPAMSFPVAIAFDSLNNSILLADTNLGTVFAVDPNNGNRTIVSDLSTGTGPELFNLDSIAIGNNNLAFVVDTYLNALFSIDLATGDRQLVSDNVIGVGPNIRAPKQVAMDIASDRILLTEAGHSALMGVNTATGDRTILSQSSMGDGPNILPESIELDLVNNRMLAAGSNTIIEIDLDSGNRELISDNGNGGWTFSSLSTIDSIAIDNDNNRVLVPVFSGVASVDLDTGVSEALTFAYAPLPEFDVGNGPAFSGFASSIALDEISNLAYVFHTDIFNFPNISVYSINSTNGDRSIISSNEIGSGFSFSYLARGLTLDRRANGGLLALDQLQNTLVSIDITTGDRTVISDNNTIGLIGFDRPSDIVVNDFSPQLVYVANQTSNSVIGVFLADGSRIPVSSDTVGVGPTLFRPESIEYDSQRAIGWVYGGGENDTLYLVDMLNGNRVIVSK